MTGSLVLLADDDPDLQEVAALVLGRHGLTVVAAFDPAAALAEARRLRPGAVIVDAGLGEASGLELCAEIRADPEVAAARLVLWSGAVLAREALAEACRIGVDRVLEKPVDLVELSAFLLRAPAASAEEALLGELAELRRGYLLVGPERLAAMLDALGRDGAGELRTLAHRMRGTAGSHGLDAVCALADRIERVAGAAERAGRGLDAAQRERIAGWLGELARAFAEAPR